MIDPGLLDYERTADAFEATAEAGPVAVDELVTALLMAAWEFDAESYDARPFRRLISRLIKEGVAR